MFFTPKKSLCLKGVEISLAYFHTRGAANGFIAELEVDIIHGLV
jgi:hypothetical protein